MNNKRKTFLGTITLTVTLMCYGIIRFLFYITGSDKYVIEDGWYILAIASLIAFILSFVTLYCVFSYNTFSKKQLMLINALMDIEKKESDKEEQLLADTIKNVCRENLDKSYLHYFFQAFLGYEIKDFNGKQLIYISFCSRGRVFDKNRKEAKEYERIAKRCERNVYSL